MDITLVEGLLMLILTGLGTAIGYNIRKVDKHIDDHRARDTKIAEDLGFIKAKVEKL